MKVLVSFVAIIALSSAAVQPRQAQPFHEHFEDFLDVIVDEAGDALEQLFDQYLEFDEFWTSLNYMATANFKNLVYEMEALPEFKAVIDFLEKDNIDITYFLDIFNDALETAIPRTRQASGKDFSSFINDCVALFPKDKLEALFDQKMTDNSAFRVAIENLQSEEWDRVWSALWENETFQNEVQTLNDNGIDLSVLLNEIMAIFGQN